jgi:hypothetical protein
MMSVDNAFLTRRFRVEERLFSSCACVTEICYAAIREDRKDIIPYLRPLERFGEPVRAARIGRPPSQLLIGCIPSRRRRSEYFFLVFLAEVVERAFCV